MSKEVITIDAEEVPIEQAVEKSFLTQLEKLEISKQALIDKKNECLQLKLNGQDKEAYVLIRETRLNMKATRVAIEKVCKKGREDATRTQKAWLAVEKDFVKIVSEGEDYLSNLEEEFETEQERIKAEIKRKQEEQFIIRQADLTKMGAQYLDGNFVLNDVSYEAILIKEADEDIWLSMRGKFNEQYLVNEESRIAEEKKKQEAEAELQRQRDEQEKKQRELEEREAAIKKKEQEEAERQAAIESAKAAEQKRLMDERNKSRSNQLVALGLNYNGQEYVFQDVNVHWVDITTQSESDWDVLINKITPVVEQRKKEVEQKRLAEIEEQKRIAAEAAVKKEQDRVAEEKRLNEERERKEAEKKAEEAMKATDKQKWQSFLAAIESISFPEMKHPAYKGKVADAQKLVKKILDL